VAGPSLVKRSSGEAAKGLVDVEQWAELRGEHFVRGVPIKQLVRRTGLSRNAVRAALCSSGAPSYSRAPGGIQARSVQG